MMAAAVAVGKSAGWAGFASGGGNPVLVFHAASFPQPPRACRYNALPISARYFDLVREMKNNAYNHRLRLAESAKERGIKPTARLFATTVPTVGKWLRRFQQQGPSGLIAQSRARHHQPHKTPPHRESQFVELRKVLPKFGARRLIREFDLPVSHGALERIWRTHGLIRKRRRKYQHKQDLAHIKARWALFQQISADTKDLPPAAASASHSPSPTPPAA
jgi:transposase